MGLRDLAPDLWVAEVPLRYHGVEIGRRMAVVRLAGGGLLVHSPAPLDGGLRSRLDELGEVRFVVPAGILHGHVHMAQYAEAYPGAELFGVPGLARKHPDLVFARELTGEPEPEWSADLDQTTFDGAWMGPQRLYEVEFLHRSSGTLITGDMCFNFGAGWPALTRLLVSGPRMRRRLGPDLVLRLGVRDKGAARRSLERILAWDFERVLPGHGDIVESGGKAELEEGYAWLLR